MIFLERTALTAEKVIYIAVWFICVCKILDQIFTRQLYWCRIKWLPVGC